MDKIKKYSNNLTLIVSEGGALSSSFAIMIGTGSVNENAKNNGISHYIEHMNFKGTKNYTCYDISNIMEKAGANFNAYTGNEVTCYYAQTIAENLEKTFSIMSEAVFQSTYLDEEAEKEKNVIIEEINMSEDTPDDVCFELSSKAFFGDDGYGRTILGSVDNVSSFTKQNVLDYLNDNYVAENTVVTFAGNVTFEQAENLVEKYILPIVKVGKKADIPSHNIINKKQSLYKCKDVEQTHFCLSFPSVSYVSSERIKSEMAVGVLGGGMSSRLFRKIREELGLAYSVYSYTSRFNDVGTVNVYAGVNSDRLDDAFNGILETLEEFKKNGISDDEFEKIKNQLKSSTVFSLERPSSKVQLFSKYYLMTGKLYDFNERMLAIDKVNKEDVEKMAYEYDINNMATAVVGRNVKPLKI